MIFVMYTKFFYQYTTINPKKAPDILSSAFIINRTIIIYLYMERVVRDSLVSVNSLLIIYCPWMQHHQLVCCRLQIFHHWMYHQIFYQYLYQRLSH